MYVTSDWLLRHELKHQSNSVFISLVTFLGISGGHLVQRQFSLGGCLRSSTVTMTETFCIYLSGRGRAGAAKEWEKKVILREVNLATAFGILQDTLAASWQAVDGAGGGLAGSWLGSPALDTHRELRS